MRITDRKGFTLIELLIVVAIIGILAAIAIPNFLEAQVRSKVARCKSEIRNLAVNLETYYIDHNNYPCPTDDLANGILKAANPAGSVTVGTVGDLGQALSTPISYTATIPLDPFRKETPASYYLGTSRGRYRYATNFLSCWIMTCYGPDQLDAGIDETPYPTLGVGGAPSPDAANCTLTQAMTCYAGPGTGIIYDATNGTTSDGDVFRVGP